MTDNVRVQPLRIPGGAVYRLVRHLDSARPAIMLTDYTFKTIFVTA
jgi:hypothetical protein